MTQISAIQIRVPASGSVYPDLFVIHRGRRYGFEFKFEDAPRTTKSMQLDLADLKLEHLWVIYPGERTIPLTRDITQLPLSQLEALAKKRRLH